MDMKDIQSIIELYRSGHRIYWNMDYPVDLFVNVSDEPEIYAKFKSGKFIALDNVDRSELIVERLDRESQMLDEEKLWHECSCGNRLFYVEVGDSPTIICSKCKEELGKTFNEYLYAIGEEHNPDEFGMWWGGL